MADIPFHIFIFLKFISGCSSEVERFVANEEVGIAKFLTRSKKDLLCTNWKIIYKQLMKQKTTIR